MKVYQQGDVLFKQVAEIPRGDMEIVTSGILVEGEATGHHHKLMPNSQVQAVKIGALLYVIAHVATKILHQEHKEIMLPPGVFFVDRVKEYDHFKEEVRRVID